MLSTHRVTLDTPSGVRRGACRAAARRRGEAPWGERACCRSKCCPKTPPNAEVSCKQAVRWVYHCKSLEGVQDVDWFRTWLTNLRKSGFDSFPLSPLPASSHLRRSYKAIKSRPPNSPDRNSIALILWGTCKEIHPSGKRTRPPPRAAPHASRCPLNWFPLAQVGLSPFGVTRP